MRRNACREAFAAWSSATLCVLVGTAATSVLVHHYGLGWTGQVRFLAALVGTVIAPGWVVLGWGGCGRRAGGESAGAFSGGLLGRLGSAMVLGLGPQLVGWALAVALHATWLAWGVPIAVLVWGCTSARRRRDRLPRRVVGGPADVQHRPGRRGIGVVRGVVSSPSWSWWLPPLFLGAWLLVLRSLVEGVWSRSPLSGSGPWYQDLYWHLSITADALHHAPPHDPQSAADGPLSYHWFSNAHAAALTLTSGVDLDAVTVLGWYVPVALAVLALVHALGKDLSGSSAVGLGGCFLFLLGPTLLPLSQLDGGGTSALYWLSPSHVLAMPVMVLGVRLLVTLLRGAVRGVVSGRLVALIAYVFILCPGTKVSALPVLMAGLGTALVMAHRRGLLPRVSWRGWPLALSGVALTVLLGTLPVFGGGGGGSRLSFGATVGQLSMWGSGGGSGFRDTLVMTATVMIVAASYAPYVLVRGAGDATDPAGWFFAGAMAAALGAMFFLEHPSRSQVYFVRGFVPVACAYLAWGVARAGRGHRRAAVIAGGFGLVATMLWQRTETYIATHRVVAGWAVPVAFFTSCLVVTLWRTARRERGSGSNDASSCDAFIGARHGPAGAAVLAALVVGASLAPGVSDVVRRPVVALASAGPVRVQDPTAAEAAGARALARANPRAEMVATNVHCLDVVSTPHCDARAFWVAALTRSPVLVGGWGYADSARTRHGEGGYSYLRQSYPWPSIAAANEAFFAHPDPTTAADLQRRGVRFVYADARASAVSPRMDAVARRLWSGAGVAVYELPSPSGG